MSSRKSRINHKLLLYAQTQSYSQFRATVIAIAVAGLTAVTVPAFVLVQPAFAREAILMVQRSLQGTNSQKPETKVNSLISQIARWEVERALLSAEFNRSHPSVTEVTHKLTTLKHQLEDIQTSAKKVGTPIKQEVTNALVDKIVALEIERSHLEVNHYPGTEVIKFTDDQIRSLRRRIAEIDPENPKNIINPVVKNALETKISLIQTKRAQFSQGYTLDDIEEIFNLDLQLRSLKQRLTVYPV